MTDFDIPHARLRNQRLTGAPIDTPEEVVSWLGAVQAQDYSGAKWALSMRTRGVTDHQIDQAFAEGAILRTHLMRPTWHFVAPADIRWLLALTAPRVHAISAYYYRSVGLDAETLKRSADVLVQALQGGKQLSRQQLSSALQQAGVATLGPLRLGYILMYAELEGIICSGPRQGKQFTYMLLDERIPNTRTLERDEALAELTRRYFTSHGPATLNDFSWWSGLTVADARLGVEMVNAHLIQEEVSGKTFWFAPTSPPTRENPPTAFLLPNYDEYGISYRDREAIFDPIDANNLIFSHMVVINGQLEGTWKRTLTKRDVSLETNFFKPLSGDEQQAVAAAAQSYGDFLELPVVMM